MGAPSEASPKQLRELHIRVVRATSLPHFVARQEASRASAAAISRKIRAIYAKVMNIYSLLKAFPCLMG
jgi:hypothetical protein